MAKIKVSELAAELGCESKELIAFLQESGIEEKDLLPPHQGVRKKVP